MAECPVRSGSISSAVTDLRALALRALRRMYLPDRGMFAFRLRRDGTEDVLEGTSHRYTAITLIGLAGEGEDACGEILHGEDAQTVCRRLLDEVHTVDNLGDVALTIWAAVALGVVDVSRAIERLRELAPCDGPHPTVELAWAVTALSVFPGDSGDGDRLIGKIADRLMASFVPSAGMFPHWPSDSRVSRFRSHVACFADLVYPIQALAYYHKRTGDTEVLLAARRCADHMCAVQGERGQWWWHFDARTGRVVERYPVYAVHQDAMAPMALFDLQEAGGGDYHSGIDAGLKWLLEPAEIASSLIDRSAGVIWRKVARHEPRKLARGIQAAASRVHPSLRVPGLGLVLRPNRIDYECRPYHLGWLLYAWPRKRVAEWT